MSINNRNQEDRSVLALLYGYYRKIYSETAESMAKRPTPHGVGGLK